MDTPKDTVAALRHLADLIDDGLPVPYSVNLSALREQRRRPLHATWFAHGDDRLDVLRAALQREAIAQDNNPGPFTVYVTGVIDQMLVTVHAAGDVAGALAGDATCERVSPDGTCTGCRLRWPRVAALGDDTSGLCDECHLEDANAPEAVVA